MHNLVPKAADWLVPMARGRQPRDLSADPGLTQAPCALHP